MEALEAGSGRRRPRSVLLIMGVVTCVALPAALLVGSDETCPADEHLEKIWNPGRRAATVESITGTQAAYAQDAAERVVQRLDAFARAWSTGYQHACEEARRTKARHLDARMRCYRRRLADLGATVETLQGATPQTLAQSVSATLRLPAPNTCDEESSAHSWTPKGPTDETLVQTIERVLARSEALRRAHRFQESAAAAREALAAAEALPGAPLLAEARTALGQALAKDGKFEDARAELESAYFDASSRGHSEQALDAAVTRVVLAKRMRNLDDGRLWAKHARALLSGPQTRDAEIHVERSAGHLEAIFGNLDPAIASLERARQLAIDAHGLDSATTAQCESLLADTYRLDGRYTEALALQRHVLQLRTDELGPSHPDVGLAHMELAGTLAKQRKPEKARAELSKAIAIEESAGETLELARMLAMLGYVHGIREDQEAQRAAYERALEIRLRRLEPDHPHITTIVQNLGTLASEQGRLDEAETLLTQALDATVRWFGPKDRLAANAHYNLAFVYRKRGELSRALAKLEEAARIWEEVDGSNHPNVVHPHRMLALWHDDPDKALAHAKLALEVAEATEIDADLKAQVFAGMALNLRRTGAQASQIERQLAQALATCPDEACRAQVEKTLED